MGRKESESDGARGRGARRANPPLGTAAPGRERPQGVVGPAVRVAVAGMGMPKQEEDHDLAGVGGGASNSPWGW